MSYPIEPNAPQFKAGIETYAAGAMWIEYGVVPGGDYVIGLYRLDPVQGWQEVEAQRTSKEALLASIQQYGGINNYMSQAVNSYINSLVEKWTVTPTPPSGEPTTGDEAATFVTQHVVAESFKLVNGKYILG